ncbi:molybdate ABC transporter substrate-binding protein [Nocardiopsis sp. NPDC050513]|uniref:molybdate ABC transporter substrate-binding protein n=1 Tax=Nocardiopsis sp. NPDC050513 TaxID=3364338 RepID=UPI0037A1F749
MPETPVPRRPRAAALRWGAPLMAGTLALTACSPAGDTGQAASGADAQGAVSGTLTVLAAASLTDVFTDLAEEFEARNPGVDVELSFAGSSALATQINSGAPADVFAAANTDTMALVVDGSGLDAAWAADHTGDGAVFATNTLRIAVPPGNPAGVEDLADLADVATALCAPEVPCGAATAAVTDAAGVEIAAVTLEEDVRAVLTKVELGEVDAGLVYATDVAAAGDGVEGVDFPESASAVNEYPIGVLADAPEPELAAAWVDLVLSGTGADVLTAAGFGAP